MIKIIIKTLLFCCCFSAAKAQIILNPRYFGAYMINNQNDTIRGMVKLPKSASKGDFSYTDVMWKFRFIGKNGIEQKITPDEAKQYTFWLENGKEITFISHPNTVKAFGGLMNNTEKMFLEQTKKGRIKLFKGYFYQKNGEVEEVSTINFIQKDNGKVRKFKYIFFRYDLFEYVKDNRELAKKLRQQEYQPKDIEAIIDEYNTWYANQPPK
jgi:hypothetical protein